MTGYLAGLVVAVVVPVEIARAVLARPVDWSGPLTKPAR